jgi:hypothetical protein
MEPKRHVEPWRAGQAPPSAVRGMEFGGHVGNLQPSAGETSMHKYESGPRSVRRPSRINCSPRPLSARRDATGQLPRRLVSEGPRRTWPSRTVHCAVIRARSVVLRLAPDEERIGNRANPSTSTNRATSTPTTLLRAPGAYGAGHTIATCRSRRAPHPHRGSVSNTMTNPLGRVLQRRPGPCLPPEAANVSAAMTAAGTRNRPMENPPRMARVANDAATRCLAARR